MLDELQQAADQDKPEPENQSKEVWGKQDIRVKTELDDRQIKGLTKTEFLAEKFGSETLGLINLNFMEMQKSRNRQSMKEFVDAHNSAMASKQPQQPGLFGFLNKPL